MRDVAAAAGVSVKTVSRVVNDEAAVRDEVADRVRAAIEALGYRPDHRAQLLRRGGNRSATVGFIPFDVSNPFFSAIYRGLEDAAWARGYAVVAGSSDGTRERGETILKRLIGGRVDGLVVVPAGDDHTLIAEEVGRGTPVVLLDLEVDSLPEVDLVRSDHRGGARLAVEHLIDHGHRDIAYLGDVASLFSARERYHGYVDAMRAAQLKPRPEWSLHGLDTTTAAKAVRALFANRDGPRPSALFSAQNAVTIGAVQALHDLGLHRVVAHRRLRRRRHGRHRRARAQRRAAATAGARAAGRQAAPRPDRRTSRPGAASHPLQRPDRPRVRRDSAVSLATVTVGRWLTPPPRRPRSTRWSPPRSQGAGPCASSSTAEHALAEVATGDDDIRPGGFVAGPAQFALADAALWYLVFGALGRIEPMALTSELSIRYLRPAIGSTLHARADLAAISRRSVVGSVTVWTSDESKPTAVAQGTYALPLAT